jgi:hypothetical protein
MLDTGQRHKLGFSVQVSGVRIESTETAPDRMLKTET